MDFLLLPLKVATLQLEPRSHCLFLPESVTWKALGTRVPLFILLKPAIILVSVNKKTARSWVRKC